MVFFMAFKYGHFTEEVVVFLISYFPTKKLFDENIESIRVIAIGSFDFELWNFRGFLAQRPESPKSTFGKLGKKHGKYQSIIFSFIFNVSKEILRFPNPKFLYHNFCCSFLEFGRH